MDNLLLREGLPVKDYRDDYQLRNGVLQAQVHLGSSVSSPQSRRNRRGVSLSYTVEPESGINASLYRQSAEQFKTELDTVLQKTTNPGQEEAGVWSLQEDVRKHGLNNRTGLSNSQAQEIRHRLAALMSDKYHSFPQHTGSKSVR